MALILNIETATKNCSVSLARDGEIISIREMNEDKYSHSEKLHSLVLEVMGEAGSKMHDLDAISVSKGPGSYTGLRIGVSAAKGLCFALDKPMIAVPTLESLALQVIAGAEGHIVPMLDARRMEVYTAVFNMERRQLTETDALIVQEDAFAEYLQKGKVYFLGDGAEKCKTLLKHPNAIFLDGLYPSSREMAVLSEQRYKDQQFEDVAYFEPFYLKDFVAGKPKRFF